MPTEPPIAGNENDVKVHDIQRTGSGTLLFFRKRPIEVQRIISQQRAAEMIAQYELSENKDFSLNRYAKFEPTPVPSLGASLGAQRAAYAAAIEKMLLSPKAPGVSLKHKTVDCDVSKPSRPPVKPQCKVFTFDDVKVLSARKQTRVQKRIEIAQATRKRLEDERSATAVHGELPNQVGIMDVVPISPGIYSVARTMAETPSPRPSVTVLSVKPVYEIRRLC